MCLSCSCTFPSWPLSEREHCTNRCLIWPQVSFGINITKRRSAWVNDTDGFSVLRRVLQPCSHTASSKTNRLCKSTSDMCLHKLQSHTGVKCNQIYTDEKVPWMLSWCSFNLEMAMEVDLVAQRLKILINMKERSCHLGQSSSSIFPSALSLEVLVQRFEWGQESCPWDTQLSLHLVTRSP